MWEDREVGEHWIIVYLEGKHTHKPHHQPHLTQKVNSKHHTYQNSEEILKSPENEAEKEKSIFPKKPSRN